MQVPASQRLLGTHVQRSSDERRQVHQILRMDENDRDQGERRRCARRSIDRAQSRLDSLSIRGGGRR